VCLGSPGLQLPEPAAPLPSTLRHLRVPHGRRVMGHQGWQVLLRQREVLPTGGDPQSSQRTNNGLKAGQEE